MKKQIKTFSEFTRHRLNESRDDSGNYPKMATASTRDHFDRLYNNRLRIEYKDKVEFIDWKPGSENSLSSWAKVFKKAEELGADPDMITFKYLQERADGKGHHRTSRHVGRNILDYEEPFDFNNYQWDFRYKPDKSRITSKLRGAFERFNQMSDGVDFDVLALQEFIYYKYIDKQITKIRFTHKGLEKLYTKFLDLYQKYKERTISFDEYDMEFKDACESILGPSALGY